MKDFLSMSFSSFVRIRKFREIFKFEGKEVEGIPLYFVVKFEILEGFSNLYDFLCVFFVKFGKSQEFPKF